MDFPCHVSGELTDLNRCFDCKANMSCDIYATMLDEVYDCMKEEKAKFEISVH